MLKNFITEEILKICEFVFHEMVELFPNDII